MTEKDLLEALSRVNSKYTDEARERAEAAARKKPRRIMMRTAAAAVGAAACFGLAMFGLSQRKMPEVTVADKDLAEQVTQIVQTSETVTETAVTLPDGVTASPDKHKTTKTVSDNNSSGYNPNDNGNCCKRDDRRTRNGNNCAVSVSSRDTEWTDI